MKIEWTEAMKNKLASYINGFSLEDKTKVEECLNHSNMRWLLLNVDFSCQLHKVVNGQMTISLKLVGDVDIDTFKTRKFN